MRYTPESHFDYEYIRDCLQETSSVADFVNQKMRESDFMRRALQLEECLVDTKGFSVLQPGRRLLREGLLTRICKDKKDQRKEQARYCFLFNDVFLYCDVQAGRKTYYQMKGQLPLDRSLLNDLIDAQSFELVLVDQTEKSKHHFQAASPEEKVLVWGPN